MKEETTQRVIAIIVKQLNVNVEEVVLEVKLSDLGADSLDNVELMMELEKEFDVKIPDNDLEKIITVGDAIDYIEKIK